MLETQLPSFPDDSIDFKYGGSELALFSAARRWKGYFATVLHPFIGSSVLEVGAGIGGTTAALCLSRHHRWVCLEPDKNLAKLLCDNLREGKLPSSCEVRAGTLNDLQADERFDTVLYIDVLEHIAEDREELGRAVNYLCPGGHLIILAPSHQWLFSAFDSAVGHFRRYSRRTLLKLTPPGTRVVLSKYLDSVGLIASLGNRVILRRPLPTNAQIRAWDSFLIPCSQILDPILGYKVGKTIVVVWQRL